MGYTPGMSTKQIIEALQNNEHTTRGVLQRLKRAGYFKSEKGRHYLTEHGLRAFRAFSDVFKPSLDAIIRDMMQQAIKGRNEHRKNGTAPA